MSEYLIDIQSAYVPNGGNYENGQVKYHIKIDNCGNVDIKTEWCSGGTCENRIYKTPETLLLINDNHPISSDEIETIKTLIYKKTYFDQPYQHWQNVINAIKSSKLKN